MRKLLLFRHAQTAKNAQGLMHQTTDAARLDEVGIAQARQLTRVFQEQGVEVVISSDETRAVETAEVPAQRMHLPVETSANLRERNWGDWSGKTWSEIQAVLAPMSLEERYTFTPPGGESWQDFEHRLTDVLVAIKNRPEDVIAVGAHGGTLRALMPLIKNEPKETSFKYDFLNCSVTIFTYQDGVFHEVIENDVSHLA